MSAPIRAVVGTVWLGEHGRVRMLDGAPVVESHDFAAFAHELATALLAERETIARYRRILGGLHLSAEIVHGEAVSLLADLADDAAAAGIDLAAIRDELRERAGERVRSRLRRTKGGR